MPSSKLKDVLKNGVLVMLVLLASAGVARAQDRDRERIRIPVGRGEVVSSKEDVRTVAIAEPQIADAAVGSARTVVVNAKQPGVTTLVVYNESGHFTVYDVEVFAPNSEKQVLLKVHVSELNQTAIRDLGIDLQASGTTNLRWIDGFLSGGLFTTKVGAIPDGNIDYVKNDGTFRFSTQWKALETKGDIRTLAEPSLLASSGQTASFLSGGQFPVPIANSGTGSTTTAGGVTVVTQPVTISWKDFGVKVEFKPTVMDDGSIYLHVAPEVSQLDFSSPIVISGLSVPIIVTRKAETSVHLRPGENLVIGGLKQTEKNKRRIRVPILGQIPILGFLFSSLRNEVDEKELVIVVTPEMVESASTRLPPMPTDRPEKK